MTQNGLKRILNRSFKKLNFGNFLPPQSPKKFNFCQALVPNPKPISPQSLQTQSQPSPTQFETQINPKGTGDFI